MPITIVYGNQRKTATFNPSPGLTLSALVQQAAEKFKLSKEREYELIYQNKPVDVSLPFRLSKIPQTATLELRTKVKNSKKIAQCKIALQLPTGKRIQGEFPSSASLWDILLHFQLEAGLNLTIDKGKPYLEPEIMFLQRKFKKFSELKNSSLSSISASGGLLRLSITPSGKTLGEIMEASPDFPLPSPPSSPSPSILEEPLQPPSIVEEPFLPSDIPAPQAPLDPLLEEIELPERPILAAEKTPAQKIEQISDQQARQAAKSEEKGSTNEEKMEIEAEKEEIIEEKLEKLQEGRKDVLMEENGVENQLKQSGEGKAEEAASPLSEKPRKKLENKEKEKKEAKKSRWEVELEPMVLPEREIKFYKKSAAKPSLSVSQESDEVFNLTAADLKALKVKTVGPVPPLERENHRRKTINAFRIVKLKVKFPNGNKMEGFFEIRETIRDVMDVLQRYLALGDKEFHLFVIPPKKVLDPNSNLYDEKLFPAAEIHFAWNDSSIREYLRSDIIFSVAEAKQTPPQVSSSKEEQKKEKEDKSSKKKAGGKASSVNPQPSGKKSGPSWFLAGKRT